MRFSRARYVTVCQQSLVTAAVLVVGVSAAGVRTLDIVPSPSRLSEQGTSQAAGAPEALPRGGPAPHRAAPGSAVVDTTPVTPTVHEVAVTGIETSKKEAAAARTQPSTTEDHKTARTPKKLAALSTPAKVQGFATVGVTWQHGTNYSEDQIGVQVRTKKDGAWSGWTTAAYHDEHGPDLDSAEAKAAHDRPGTDAVVIGDVDEVQMRAETADGSTPPDLKLAVIDPGTGATTTEKPAIDTATLPSSQPGDTATTTASDAQALSTADGEPVDNATLSAMKVAPKPYIYSRAQWGANEKLRDQTLPGYGTIKAGFIHHTVNANNYTADQVPSLLRGIYAYHTQSRGWRDIGYNFLVDRFGRIWEGRWGGVDKAVIGAHTEGYNEVSFAMSAIGNYDIADPPQAVSDAYARLFAWKLSMYNIRADAMHIYVKNRYMNAINGHRDVGQTACPGKYLYAKIPAIRAATQALQNAAQSGTPVTPTPTPTPPPVTFTSPTQAPQPATNQPVLKLPTTLNLADTGSADLLVKNTAGQVRVQPTGGQTGFLPGVATPGAWSVNNIVVGVGDVTGDGRGDVIARRGTVTKVYRGIGYGKISTTGTNATSVFAKAYSLVGAGDLNGDGKSDVLMRTVNGAYLYLVPGLGAGTFGTPKLIASGWGGMTSIAVAGDLDRNGTPDLVALNRNGWLYVVPSNGRGTLGPARQVQQVGTEYTLVAGAGDLDGDGIGDVAVRNGYSQVAILTGDGKGGFGPRLGWFGGFDAVRSFTGASMTGTGAPDLVGLNTTRTQVVVYPNNGLTNVRSMPASNLTVPSGALVYNVGDWNGDGIGDVVSRENGNDRLVLHPGLGNGQYGAPVTMSDGWRPFANIVALGDVTGDGKPDLVGRTGANTPVVIIPGNGKTGFLPPVLAPVHMRAYSLVGSGTWQWGNMPTASFYGPGGGFVPFAGTTGGWMSGYTWVVGPGDVDGDGQPDVVASDAKGVVWLLPGTPTGLADRRYLFTLPAGYSLAG